MIIYHTMNLYSIGSDRTDTICMMNETGQRTGQRTIRHNKAMSEPKQ